MTVVRIGGDYSTCCIRRDDGHVRHFRATLLSGAHARSISSQTKDPRSGWDQQLLGCTV